MIIGSEKKNGSFEFWRPIRYRNSFLPIVSARAERTDGRTTVHVKMRLNWFVAGFMGLWITMAVPFGAAAGIGAVLRGDLSGFSGLIFPLFAWALCGGGFAFEARKMDKLLFSVLPPPEVE